MSCSNVDITKVIVLDDYNLHLHFNDGRQGNVNIAKLIPFKGVFAPLKDRNFFAKVTVNHDIGTICWENGADLSPTFLWKSIEPKFIS